MRPLKRVCLAGALTIVCGDLAHADPEEPASEHDSAPFEAPEPIAKTMSPVPAAVDRVSK